MLMRVGKTSRLLALGMGLCGLVSVTIAAPARQLGGATEAPKRPYRERLLSQAQAGDHDAQFELGKNYEAGRIGLPKDLAQARFWYEQSAAQADPYAEASLGILYNFGKGVKQDYFTAYVWYERAVLHSVKGDRDSVIELRDWDGHNLTKQEIERATEEAHRWKPPAKGSPAKTSP